jgi:hypothetical protein
LIEPRKGHYLEKWNVGEQLEPKPAGTKFIFFFNWKTKFLLNTCGGRGMFFKLKFFSESKLIDERILGYESGGLWFLL